MHIHTHTHTHTHTYPGPPRFVEMPVEKRTVLSWALKSERVGRFRKLAGSEYQTVGAMKLKEQSPAYLKLRLGIVKSFSLANRRDHRRWASENIRDHRRW